MSVGIPKRLSVIAWPANSTGYPPGGAGVAGSQTWNAIVSLVSGVATAIPLGVRGMNCDAFKKRGERKLANAMRPTPACSSKATPPGKS